MAIIVILCGAPHLYKKDMNNSGLVLNNPEVEMAILGRTNRNDSMKTDSKDDLKI